MNINSLIYKKLKRETSSGFFIPEIDGLRFLAIFIVVIFHIQLFFVAKTPYAFSYDGVLYRLIGNGFKGVEMFFVVSGFILALPFAKFFLLGLKKPNLKHYYYRRLTRLEPPYFIALVIFFVLHMIKGVYPTRDLFNGLIQNIFYIQNLAPFQHFQAMIGNITWTLEVEVQFYLIAPFLAYVFSLKKISRRLMMIISIIILSILNSSIIFDYVTLYAYLNYFLIGFLIADLYIIDRKTWFNKMGDFFVGFLALAVFLLIDVNPVVDKIIFQVALFVLVYSALTGGFWRAVYGNKVLTTIGGMCYSLYLLHTVIISGIGNKTVLWQISNNYLINIIFQILLMLPCILVISGVYFILIEKPCMYKDWPIKIKNKIKLYYLRLAAVS